jgi:hypothetical protein
MFDIWARFEAKVQNHALATTQALAVERKIQKRRSRRSNWTTERQTLHEIGALIQLRHQGSCDTDDGEIYLRAALPSIIRKAGGFDAEDLHRDVVGWAGRMVPRLDRIAINDCIEEARQRNADKRLWMKAHELGSLLRLTISERESLGITRFRPMGMTVRQFQKYQQARRAAQEKARRVAKGARPREQSKAQLKPWEALGMSRPTYYRMQKAGTLPAQIRDRETVSLRAGTKYLQPVTGESHTLEQTVPDPARSARPNHGVRAVGHTPSAKTRAVPIGRAVALPLPVGGVSELPDMLGGGEWKQINEVVTAYDGGVLPEALKRAVRDAQRVRQMTQQAVANQIGISRPQLANALQGRFGLSRSAASNLLEWLAA